MSDGESTETRTFADGGDLARDVETRHVRERARDDAVQTPGEELQSIGFTQASETFTWIWPAPAGGISTSASLRLAMVSAGLPSAPYAEACQAFMVGMVSVRWVVK